MFNLFDKKPDHPLYDLTRTKQLLAELPRDDARKSLGEITGWLDSIKSADGFSVGLRSSTIILLDEAAQSRKEELLHSYLSAPHLRDFQGLHLWQDIHAYIKALSDAYAASLREYQQAENKPFDLRERMPLVCVRQLRAASEQMKLEMMRYIEVEPSVWQHLCACYQFAETENCAERMLIPYPGHVIHTSPQRELLRALVLYISLPGALAADQIEVSYRITGRLSNFFDLKQAADADCPYLFDLSANAPPHKIDSNFNQSTTTRFFGAVKAIPALKKVFDQNENDPVWQEQRFSSEFTPAGKLTVLKHLMSYWVPEPPRRHMERRGISATVEVTHGFRVISQLVAHIDAGESAEQDAGAAQQGPKFDLAAAAELDYASETWNISDMSASGIGAILTGSQGAWIKVGNLCALKPQNSQLWWVGMIRRLHTDNEKKVHVGIELLAKRPASAWFRILGKGAERVSNWETSSGSFKYDYLPVILLPDEYNSYLKATMLMESGHFVPDTIYQAMIGEKSRDIKLIKLLAEGEDYEQVGFEWLS